MFVVARGLAAVHFVVRSVLQSLNFFFFISQPTGSHDRIERNSRHRSRLNIIISRYVILLETWHGSRHSCCSRAMVNFRNAKYRLRRPKCCRTHSFAASEIQYNRRRLLSTVCVRARPAVRYSNYNIIESLFFVSECLYFFIFRFQR